LLVADAADSQPPTLLKRADDWNHYALNSEQWQVIIASLPTPNAITAPSNWPATIWWLHMMPAILPAIGQSQRPDHHRRLYSAAHRDWP